MAAMPDLQGYSVFTTGRFPCLGSTTCFRAKEKATGLPVLLHRFRPERLLDHKPVVDDQAPDFTEPFVTRFTGIVSDTRSAWLVEPLPDCIAGEEAWRTVIQRSPLFLELYRRILDDHVARASARHECRDHPRLSRIVLTRQGIYGLLNDHLRCSGDALRIRPAGPDSDGSLCDDLLQIEIESPRRGPICVKGVNIPCSTVQAATPSLGPNTEGGPHGSIASGV